MIIVESDLVGTGVVVGRKEEGPIRNIMPELFQFGSYEGIIRHLRKRFGIRDAGVSSAGTAAVRLFKRIVTTGGPMANDRNEIREFIFNPAHIKDRAHDGRHLCFGVSIVGRTFIQCDFGLRERHQGGEEFF